MKHFKISHKIQLPKIEHSARGTIYWGYLKLNEVKRFYTLSNDLNLVECDCRIIEKFETVNGKGDFDNLIMQVKYDNSDKWVDRWFTPSKQVCIAQQMMIAGEVSQELYKVQKKYDDLYMRLVDEYNEEIQK